MFELRTPEWVVDLISKRILTFSGAASLYLFSLFVLPTYFGIDLGFFDLNASRLFLVIVLLLILKNQKRKQVFLSLIKLRYSMLFFLLFIIVAIYTNIFRRSFSGIFLFLIDTFIAFWVILYLIKYEFGIDGIISRIKNYAFILSICGLIEAVIKKSPFSYLNTLHYGSETALRYGSVRICGPCTTSNGYGLFLLILLALVCVDCKNRQISILKNKFLVFLILINLFLTGARLSLGLSILELALLFLFSNRKEKLKTLLLFGIIILFIGIFVVILPDWEISQTILRSIYQIVDVAFNTNYANLYGSNSEELANSNYYRKLLLQIFSLEYLNPWLGRGSSYHFSYVIEGYWLRSLDNYYVGLYVFFGYPGLISFILMSIQVLYEAVLNLHTRYDYIAKITIIIFICYYIGLWYLDQLQTYKFVYVVIAILFTSIDAGHAKEILLNDST